MNAPARRALVIGVSGIAGQSTARHLIADGWQVTGVGRRLASVVDGVDPIAVDLLDRDAVAAALKDVQPEIVVITAWIRKPTETENIEVNGALVRNVLDALEPSGGVRHVALLTGLKHYLGPFDDYATAVMAETPFHEDEPRLPNPNFYYTQEDELFAAAARQGFTWSVHRAHTVFGYAVDNAMNMVLTLSVYASICRATGRPFVFPGSVEQWNGVVDVTDSDLLAEQLIWASTNPDGQNQAFNIANGDTFRWRWLWPQIARHFGVEPEGPESEPRTLEATVGPIAADAWQAIAVEHDLVEHDVAKLASWWHSDSDLGRRIECFTDMTKSREAGFLGFRSSPKSFFEKVERYRNARILP